MAEIRYGQPGLFAAAKLGREPKNDHLYVFDSKDAAVKDALAYTQRNNEWIVYELVEVARILMPEPVIETPEGKGESR